MLAIRGLRESGVRERVTETSADIVARARLAVLTGATMTEAERLITLAALDALINDQRGTS